MKTPNPMYTIWRNGRLYDSLDPDSHDVKQITHSLAMDFYDDRWEARDENMDLYYSCQTSKGPPP